MSVSKRSSSAVPMPASRLRNRANGVRVAIEHGMGLSLFLTGPMWRCGPRNILAPVSRNHDPRPGDAERCRRNATSMSPRTTGQFLHILGEGLGA